MNSQVRIALVGDYRPEVVAHVAIPRALQLAGDVAGLAVEPVWIPTDRLGIDVRPQLAGFDGIWCVPGSPYASMTGALAAIRFARESGRPFLGTCGGFQHTLIEFARNVLHLAEADHLESNREAALPLIAPLACSLVGLTGRITFAPGSRVRAIYGSDEVVEAYHCNYGFNSDYGTLFAETKLRFTGVDEEGQARVVELLDHPFFVATLFQPERSALRGVAHPLIVAFIRAARAASDAVEPLRASEILSSR